MRPNIDEYYLGIALAVSKRSTCIRRQYGAVIVNNDEIIATRYNGSPRGEINCCDKGTCERIKNNTPHNCGDYSDCCSVHAEQNCLLSASRRDTIGGTLYLMGTETYNVITDIKPCPICRRLIKNAGISRLVTAKGEIKI